jgi:hypothetical protein
MATAGNFICRFQFDAVKKKRPFRATYLKFGTVLEWEDTYTVWNIDAKSSMTNMAVTVMLGYVQQVSWYFFSVAQQPNSGLGRLIVAVPRSHTLWHVTPCRTSLNEWSARRRGRYLHNTQQTEETNIHPLSGIRTRDPSNQSASDPRRRPHGYRYRQYPDISLIKLKVEIVPVVEYHAMVTWGSGDKAPHIYYLCPRWRWVMCTLLPLML